MPNAGKPRLVKVAGREAWHIYHQRNRISTGSTDRASAEKVLARYISGEDAPKENGLTIAKILELYLSDRLAAKKRGYERLMWAHKRLNRVWGQKPVEAVTDETCRAYAVERREDGVSDGTIRTELEAMRAALKWAEKKKKIDVAPEIEMPPKPASKDRWLTRKEADKLRDACKAQHVRLFVLLGLHTAARMRAILDLQWDDIDFDGRLVEFPTVVNTTKLRATVPINDTLLSALTEAHENRTSKWVVEWAGDRVGSVRHAFQEACDRAGLKDVTPHTLRHTAATWMAKGGVPMWQIAKYLGHTSTEMVERTYAHHDPSFLQAAAKALG
jgi:integrase